MSLECYSELQQSVREVLVLSLSLISRGLSVPLSAELIVDSRAGQTNRHLVPGIKTACCQRNDCVNKIVHLPNMASDHSNAIIYQPISALAA